VAVCVGLAAVAAGVGSLILSGRSASRPAVAVGPGTLVIAGRF
jgi:hypothetical protein